MKNVDKKKRTDREDSHSCTINTLSEGKVFYGEATMVLGGRKKILA